MYGSLPSMLLSVTLKPYTQWTLQRKVVRRNRQLVDKLPFLLVPSYCARRKVRHAPFPIPDRWWQQPDHRLITWVWLTGAVYQ